MTAATAFTVLIPARMASSRLPDKPLAEIAGLPMVVQVARRAAQSAARRTVVAADDARIVEACQRHGVEVIATRADHPSGSDRLAEACALLGLQGDDVVVNVQGDEPLIDPQLINAVAGLLDAHPERDVDLLLMCVAGWTTTPRFVPRVMGALRPGAVLLSHWDNFFLPMSAGAKALPAMQLPRLVDGLTAIDPSVRVGTVPLLGHVLL